MLTPKEIVESLDKYIIGQKNAKRAVAIALRNRYRRAQLPEELQAEIYPKNIIMMGPTGVGKTEIARRLAKLVDAPFVKVEATKFTEVGYVGRDVDSMIRDLIEVSVRMTKDIKSAAVSAQAHSLAENRMVDLLFKGGSDDDSDSDDNSSLLQMIFNPSSFNGSPEKSDVENDDNTVISLPEAIDADSNDEKNSPSRENILNDLRNGKLNKNYIEITVDESGNNINDAFMALGVDANMGDVFGGFLPKKKKKRRVTVENGMHIFEQEEADKLIDMDDVISEAITRAEQEGIIFIDEIDKIAEASRSHSGPDVSREGVQRDILPIVEGCAVSTKYGIVNTDHMLFITAGAFHMSKVSDLIPELQGRFPIHVQLNALTKEDFKLILTQPQNAIITQYEQLLAADNIIIDFDESAIDSIAGYAYEFNENHENIGARRLQTILENILDEVSFETGAASPTNVHINAEYVSKHINEDVAVDLHRYIL